MRVLVLNPNTSESMTAEIAAAAAAVAAEGTEIVAGNPRFGATASTRPLKATCPRLG